LIRYLLIYALISFVFIHFQSLYFDFNEPNELVPQLKRFIKLIAGIFFTALLFSIVKCKGPSILSRGILCVYILIVCAAIYSFELDVPILMIKH
jgi:hypothetical protein